MNILFTLRAEKNKKGESPIEFSYTHGGERARLGCRITVNSNFFKDEKVTNKDPLFLIKNKKIDDIKAAYNTVLLTITSLGEEPKPAMVCEKMKEILFPHQTNSLKAASEESDIHKDFNQFIKDSVEGKRKYNNVSLIKESTIKSYKTTRNHLLNFFEHQGHEFLYSDLGEDFYIDFVDFLRYRPEKYKRYKKKDVNNDGSIDKEIKVLKTFLNYGIKQKWHNEHGFSKIMDRIGYDPKPFALAEKNLLQLINTPTFTDDRLQIARDLFLFGVIGCLRISDQMILSYDDNITSIDGGVILNFIPNKTNTSSGNIVSINIPDFGVDIINKYRGGEYLLPRFSEKEDTHKKEYNLALKELVSFMDWDDVIVKTTKKVAGVVEFETLRLKEKMTSHLQRKTGVTNYANSKKVSEVVARTLGGFTVDSRAFKQYIDIDDEKMNTASKLTWDAVLKK